MDRLPLPESVSPELCAEIIGFANETGGGAVYRIEVVDGVRSLVHVPVPSGARAALVRLRERRARLQALLDEVDAEIDDQLGRPRSSNPATAPTTDEEAVGTLEDTIRRVLVKVAGPMKLAHIRDAVLDAGYVTNSKTFRVIVGQRLGEMHDVTKVGRGVYQLVARPDSSSSADDAPGGSAREESAPRHAGRREETAPDVEAPPEAGSAGADPGPHAP